MSQHRNSSEHSPTHAHLPTHEFTRERVSISESMFITEARSEGLIELKLVRKPPKVSRGYGGVARAAYALGLQKVEDVSAQITILGVVGSPDPSWEAE